MLPLWWWKFICILLSLFKIIFASGNWQIVSILNTNKVSSYFLSSIDNTPFSIYFHFQDVSIEARMKFHVQVMVVEKLLTRYSEYYAIYFQPFSMSLWKSNTVHFLFGSYMYLLNLFFISRKEHASLNKNSFRFIHHSIIMFHIKLLEYNGLVIYRLDLTVSCFMQT